MGMLTGILKEFREFAVRGNVIDMAIGIIIGAAFGKIVTSLVNDVVMPPIGVLIGNMDFSNLAVELSAATEKREAIFLRYGQFINTVLDFVIIAFAIFLVVKQMNRLKRQSAGPAEPVNKECPRCCTKIPVKATRCPQCTSELKAA